MIVVKVIQQTIGRAKIKVRSLQSCYRTLLWVDQVWYKPELSGAEHGA